MQAKGLATYSRELENGAQLISHSEKMFFFAEVFFFYQLMLFDLSFEDVLKLLSNG